MKKRWIVSVCVLLLFSLTACGGNLAPEDENYRYGTAQLELGNLAKAYDYFKASTDPRAAEMLEHFVFVPTEITRKTSSGRDTVTAYAYDTAGYCISEKETGKTNWTETVDKEERYTYDKEQRLLTHHYRYGDYSYTESYTYDEQGNELSYTCTYPNGESHPNGYVCTYDEKGNLLTKTYWDKQNEDYTYSHTYTYNDQGQVLTYTTTDGEDTDLYTYFYNEDGSYYYSNTYEERTITNYFDKNNKMVKAESVDNDTDEVLYLTEYRYDEQGNEIYRCERYDDTESVTTHAYNEQGKLLQAQTTENGDVNRMSAYTYDEAGRELTYDYFSGTSSWGHTANTYNEHGLLLLQQRQGEWGWEKSTLTYDESGNCIKAEETGTTQSGTYDYTYDRWGNVLTYAYYGKVDGGENATQITLNWQPMYYPDDIPISVSDMLENIAYLLKW